MIAVGGLKPSARVLGYRSFQVLAYVQATIAVEGRAPSYGMIADELGINKPKVCDIVKRLERRGLLLRVGSGRVRRIRLRCVTDLVVSRQRGTVRRPGLAQKPDDGRETENCGR